MKYRYKTAILGDERIIESFLWFPKCIDNEWRWLEFARWREKTIYYNPQPIPSFKPMMPKEETVCFRWVTVEWIDGGTFDNEEQICKCHKYTNKWRDCDLQQWFCCECKKPLKD